MKIAAATLNTHSKRDYKQLPFKSRITIEPDAQEILDRYGADFITIFNALLTPVKEHILTGLVNIKTSKRTRAGIVFDIESKIQTARKCRHHHDYVLIDDNMKPVEGALKLASAVFKPFIRRGKSTPTRTPIPWNFPDKA